MNVNLFSFITAVIWNGIFTIVIYLLHKSKNANRCISFVSISLLYLFSVIRMLVPVEPPHTFIIANRSLYPVLYDFLRVQWFSMPLWSILIAIWLSGVLILLARYVFQYYKGAAFIKKYAALCGGREQNILREIRRMQNKKMKADVYYIPNIETPFGFGIFKKAILLPQKQYSDDALRFILMHEYTHFIHKDTAVKLFISLFCIIFWWNPAAYLLRKDLEQTLEIKCDIAVASNLDLSEKSAYLHIIINTLKDYSGKHTLPRASAALFKPANASVIKKRFTAVMQCGPQKRRSKWEPAILCCFILLLFFSYITILQPAGDPPPNTDPNIIEFDRTNAYIQHTTNGEYWLCIENQARFSITQNEANKYEKAGFIVKQLFGRNKTLCVLRATFLVITPFVPA